MRTVPFDTLKLVRDLRDNAKFSSEQAEGMVTAFSEAFEDKIATKDDLDRLEQRITIKIGSMLVIAIGLIVTLVKLIH